MDGELLGQCACGRDTAATEWNLAIRQSSGKFTHPSVALLLDLWTTSHVELLRKTLSVLKVRVVSDHNDMVGAIQDIALK